MATTTYSPTLRRRFFFEMVNQVDVAVIAPGITNLIFRFAFRTKHLRSSPQSNVSTLMKFVFPAMPTARRP